MEKIYFPNGALREINQYWSYIIYVDNDTKTTVITKPKHFYKKRGNKCRSHSGISFIVIHFNWQSSHLLVHSIC